MAKTQAKTGKGTQFKCNGVLVGERTKLGLSGRKADTVDATHMDSPPDPLSGNIAKEFIAGLVEFGSFDVDANFVPGDAGQAALLAAFGNVATYQLISADNTWSFSADGIADSGPDYDFEQSKPNTFKCKIKITGPITTVGI